MKKITLQKSSCVLFLLLLTSQTVAKTLESHTYLETTGSQTTILTWDLELEDTARIIARKNDVTFYNICDLTGYTHEWEMRKAATAVKAYRQNERIYFQGTLEGEKISKTFIIDKHPWYQPLTFSLRSFIASEQKSTFFWMIRLDNFSVIKMEATKKETECIFINGEKIEAHRVWVQPTGLLSHFWHGQYWYRKTDGLFLQYKGKSILPGIKKTIIRINDETL